MDKVEVEKGSGGTYIVRWFAGRSLKLKFACSNIDDAMVRVRFLVEQMKSDYLE